MTVCYPLIIFTVLGISTYTQNPEFHWIDKQWEENPMAQASSCLPKHEFKPSGEITRPDYSADCLNLRCTLKSNFKKTNELLRHFNIVQNLWMHIWTCKNVPIITENRTAVRKWGILKFWKSYIKAITTSRKQQCVFLWCGICCSLWHSTKYYLSVMLKN